VKPFVWSTLWEPELSPVEVLVRSAIVYLGLLVVFRLIGRKELSRYSPFDFAVILLVATALRKSLVGDDDSLTTAFVALGTILGLDVLLSWLAFRSRLLARVLEGPPRQLVDDGKPIDEALRRSRFTREELVSRLRKYGIDRLEDVQSAWLERDGHVTFVIRGALLPRQTGRA
jgi:uncharacterized membrane protein YcaP (DUF421 family)